MSTGAEPLMRLMLSSSLDGVLAFDTDCRYTWWNPAMERISGLPAARVVGCLAFEIFPFLVETGEDHCFREALAGRTAISRDRTYVIPESGRHGFFEGSYAPLRDDAGAVVGGVGIIRDITERKRTEDQRLTLARIESARRRAEEEIARFSLLADASVVLSSALDYGQTLQKLAQLAVPRLGDLCTVDVLEGDRVRRVAVAHVEPEKAALIEQMRDRYPARFGARHPSAEALGTGKPVLLAEVDADTIARRTDDAEHAALIRAVGIRSHLSVPLVARGAILGAISVAITRSGRRYGEEDVALVSEVARRAALGIDNARLYDEARQELAERRRAETALRLSEQRFRGLMQQSPLSTQMLSPDGWTVEVNQAWRELWGISIEQLADYNMLRDPQLEARGVAPFLRRAFAGEAVAIPAIKYDPDETLPGRSAHSDPARWVRAFAYPVKDETDVVREVVLVHEDVTAHVRADQALRSSEERLQILADAGAALAGSLDDQATLDRLAQILSPRLAERVTVELIAEGGRLECVAEHGQAPPDPATVSVPLKVGDRMIGVLTLLRPKRRPFGEADVDLAADVARRAAVVVENVRLYQRLRSEDRRKDEFLATLAHELRNPLAPIRSGLEILRVAGDRPSGVRAREIMERQVSHMVRLIDDLLDVSRVTSGKIQLRKERVDLWALVGTAIEASRPLIDAAGLELEVRLASEPLVLEVDRTRIAQVLSNLLNNAAKYTERGGRITVSARREAGDVLIQVADTGVGIPREMLGQVFDMFAQVGRSLDRSQGGLGIGLTLVRRLVDLHGGRVWAESDGAGRGSAFFVRLPVAGTAAAVDAGAPPGAEPVSAAGRRVLIVDDNEDAASTLADLLGLAGHEVLTAGTAGAALEILTRFAPDVAFLDIGLPGMNGYELARRIRADPARAGTTLIAVTGWGQDEDRRQSREAGFDRHLTKPVDPAEVQQLVSAAAPERR